MPYKFFKKKHFLTKRRGIKISRPRSSKKIFISFFFLFIVAVSVIYFGIVSILNRQNPLWDNNKEEIKLEINAPDQTVSGEEIVYAVSVVNQGDIDLRKAELVLKFDRNFHFKSSSPEITKPLLMGGTWNLGQISGRDKKIIEITGRLVGNSGDKKSLEVELNYQMANLSAGFQKKASAETMVTSSVVDLNIKAPNKILKNDGIIYEIEFENTGKTDLENVKMTVDCPEGFVLKSAEPLPLPDSIFSEGKEKNWSWEKIKQNEKETVKLSGLMTGESERFQELKVRIGTVEADNLPTGQAGLSAGQTGNWLILAEKENLVFVAEPKLTLNLKFNGKSDGEQSADWDDVLEGELIYKNDGELEMKDVFLKIGLTDALNLVLNKEKLASESGKNGFVLENLTTGGGGQNTETVLSWDKGSAPALALVKPGDEGKIDFQIFINPLAKINREPFFSQYSFAAKAWAFGWLTDLEEKDLSNNNFQIDGNQIAVKINTQLFLDAQAQYAAAPSVEGFEEYWISWKLSNTTNDAREVEVSAVLPEGISWAKESRVTVGQNLNFDEQNRRVVWQIGKLPAFTGGSLSSVEADFKVTVSPDVPLNNQYIDLTEDTFLKATDDFTNRGISLRQGPIVLKPR